MGGKELSDTARGREVFKYYQPTLLAEPQKTPHIPRSSRDTTLTSFAQLGTLRISTKRALISLFAREQYIVAEATQTLSLQCDAVHEEADALWMGEAVLPRKEGPCSVAFDVFTGAAAGERNHLIVEDLSQDPRFNGMKSVVSYPFTKFYAAVPIVTPKGGLIGTFAVLDDEPRKGISDAQLAFMKEISSTITNYLESRKAKQQHQRAEKMIRGLGLYVEGKSSIRDWWLVTGHKINDDGVKDRLRKGESLSQQADEEFGVQDAPDVFGRGLIVSSRSSTSLGGSLASRGVLTPAVSNESRPRYFRAHSETSGSAASVAASVEVSEGFDTTSNKPPEASDTSFSQNTSQSGHNTSSPLDDHSGARLQEATLSNELKESFSRASNLIRESIAVDGALFLDASIGTFGGSLTNPAIGSSGPSARDNQGSTPVSSSSSDGPQKENKKNVTNSPKHCGILGYSTTTRSSLNMHEPSSLHLSVAESFLRKLLRRYPHGKVFNFDDEGSLSSSEDDIRKTFGSGVEIVAEQPDEMTDEGRHQRRKTKRVGKDAEAKEILKLLPGARSVAFFPLWDSHKERWFSGSVVWTTSPTRVLDPEEDLTYLASFGNSIMAEVARLDAVLKSQLKDSFVSSISHELRSPLHGVLASVEFLQESRLDSLQQEMVNIIGSCGRTLLDTINHVLDFTKFKSKSKESMKNDNQNRSRGNSRMSHALNRTLGKSKHPVDVRVLTEEVLEGVYTGSGFGKSPSITSSSVTSTSTQPSSLSETLPMIIVTMDWRSDWGFDVDPGAWRRLVMNVFGNALKYTESGFIRVSLGSRVETKASKGSATMITLTVSDSGKGISKEFLNHHLYTPFAQEDSLAVGSGLGLSIVQNIVNELAGSISIESEQDSGTDVTITLPLMPAKLSASLAEDQDAISQLRQQVQGHEVCLIGFDSFPSLGDEPTGILSIDARQTFYFKDSLAALFEDWFSMNVVLRPDLGLSAAKISVIMESSFNNFMADGFQDVRADVCETQKSFLLVLCPRMHRAPATVQHPFFEIQYIQQPIGPHKVATLLARYFASAPLKSSMPANLKGPSAPDAGMERSQYLGALTNASSHVKRPPLSHTVSSRGTTARSRNSTFSPPTLSTSSSTSDEDRPTARSINSFASSKTAPHDITNTNPIHCNVLLVEDNAINLKLLVTYMQKLGITYVTAVNGLLAVQEYQKAGPFQLVIMDISMPVMNGLEASRQIRHLEQESRSSRTAIVALTGAADEAARQEAFSAGIDQYLTKPVSLKVLKGFVDHYGLTESNG